MARLPDTTSACAGARTTLAQSDKAHRHWRHRSGRNAARTISIRKDRTGTASTTSSCG